MSARFTEVPHMYKLRIAVCEEAIRALGMSVPWSRKGDVSVSFVAGLPTKIDRWLPTL
jgi:hypothetical protein